MIPEGKSDVKEHQLALALAAIALLFRPPSKEGALGSRVRPLCPHRKVTHLRERDWFSIPGVEGMGSIGQASVSQDAGLTIHVSRNYLTYVVGL